MFDCERKSICNARAKFIIVVVATIVDCDVVKVRVVVHVETV